MPEETETPAQVGGASLPKPASANENVPGADPRNDSAPSKMPKADSAQVVNDAGGLSDATAGPEPRGTGSLMEPEPSAMSNGTGWFRR